MSASDSPIEGIWRAEGRAKGTPARLAIGENGEAVITATDNGGELVRDRLAGAEISTRVGSIPRHLTFAGRGDFETTDNDGVDALLRGTAAARSGLVHSLEGFRPRLIVFVGLTLVLCFALYRYAVPILVEVAVAVTPPVVTDLMSQGVLISLDQSIFEPSGLTKDRQAKLAKDFESIATLTSRASEAVVGKPAYTLHFRKGGAIGPNAFALPDGTIVMTDELVEMAKDDEMLLGVLAHEMGHVDFEHSLRQLYRAAGVTTLVMLIGGDIGSGTEDVLVQGAALISLAYSREAEAQADRYSVELMHRAGHDPAAIARFFELIRDRFGDVSTRDFLSTHPATPERIAETRRYAAEVAETD